MATDIPKESTVFSYLRSRWLSPEVATEKILDFEFRFGEKHLMLACHAALPLFVSPELINLIRINFLESKKIPWVADIDILLSSLCRPMEKNFFEFEPSIREELIFELEQKFGRNRPLEVAIFLQSYIAHKPEINDIRSIQRWIALAYSEPNNVIREILQELSQAQDKVNIAKQVQAITVIEITSEQLQESSLKSEYHNLIKIAKFLDNKLYNLDKISDINYIDKIQENKSITTELSETYNSPDLSLNTESQLNKLRKNIDSTYLSWQKLFDKKVNRKKEKKKEEKNIESKSICLIGPRSSGKTTYLAALARWPFTDPSGPIKEVTPLNSESENLLSLSRNILEQGFFLEPTHSPRGSISDLPSYSLRITLNVPRSTLGLSRDRYTQLSLNFRDYPGEIFSINYESLSSNNQKYLLEDLSSAQGLMIFIDGLSYRKDIEYSHFILNFLDFIDTSEFKNKTYSIAIVITKCEQPELWVSRQSPDQFMKIRFPELHRIMERGRMKKIIVFEYFMASSFGVLGKRYPEPNMINTKRSISESDAILKRPRLWKPFGLVAPLYWLSTGKRDDKLDD